MNPQSRFIRGRARGGGAYRPYFYFRRNGRVIPGGGAPGGSALGDEESVGGRGRGRGRGWKRRGPAATANLLNSSGLADADNLESTFLRPEHFAAPEGALNIHSITAIAPPQCPGWRLYFLKDDFNATSPLALRIKAVGEHYSRYPAHYDLIKISRDCHFTLHANVVNADQTLAQVWPQLLQDFKARPQLTMAVFGAAMHAIVTSAALDASLSQQQCRSDRYTPHYLRPRKIYARPLGFADVATMANIDNCDLDTLYCVRGSVAAVGSVEAAASWISFKCARCNLEQAMKQSGVFVSRPFACKNNECPAKKGFIEQRASPFTRITPVQIVRLLETSIDNAVDQSTYFDIELRDDLVDAVAPGQNVVITGIPKMHPLADSATAGRSTAKTDVFQVYLKALSVQDAKHVGYSFSERDLEHITAVNSEQDSLKLLVNSLAPEVHGQEIAKAGVLLSLFGGSGSQLHDEGDIHVLLVGDPGIGKSHTLQMCAKITEKGTSVSGKGQAANKLIASVQGRHQHFLQSGAIVSSTNGHCTVDDIDRLATQQDALLQVMQSRIIAMPFAGICTTLTTPTAVIATANSTRGHYDHAKLLTENIRISPTLLSEFHLVFVLSDRPSRCSDAALTEHVRAMHDGAKKSSTIAARFAVKPKSNQSMSIALNHSNDSEMAAYHDLAARLKLDPFCQMELLPTDLMKKFICKKDYA